MAEGKDLKPKSFRIDNETAEKFKEISGRIGGNQQETLAKLIEAFEFQTGKAILTEKKADIEMFEKYCNAITRMYMGSLEDNQNITETVRTEFDALLKSKDTTIQDLQKKLSTATKLKNEAVEKAKVDADENVRLSQTIDNLQKEYVAKMSDMQSMLADKENLNKTLLESCGELKSKMETMLQDAEDATRIREERDRLQADYDTEIKEKAALENQLLQAKKDNEKNIADMERQSAELQKRLKEESVLALNQAVFETEKKYEEQIKQLLQEISDYEKNIADLKQQSAETEKRLKEKSSLELNKAVFETQKQYEEQIQKIKENKQMEVDKYQNKYFDLLEQIRNQADHFKASS